MIAHKAGPKGPLFCPVNLLGPEFVVHFTEKC